MKSTPIRIEILKLFLLRQNQDHTIAEIKKHLGTKGKLVSVSTIADILMVFKARKIVSAKIVTKDLKQKRGRPSTQHFLSKEFTKIYAF